jgi:hypothetical protein
MMRVNASSKAGRLSRALPLLWTPLVALAAAFPLHAAEPLLKELVPPGAQRGKTFTLALRGDRLAEGAEIITTLPAAVSRLAPRRDLERPDTELLFLVQLSPDAPVGLYPIRVRTEEGLSNVAIFSVGDLPEASEEEPNNSMAEAQAINAPVAISGHLTAADQDFFRVSAKAHERLVFEVEARRLASAIDPALEILDSSGRRLAFNDDAGGLGVDARVDVTFPKGGSYFVVVHDSKYSEQETTFYRLKVGSYPYADGIFPLGWQRGKAIDVTFFGGNLAKPVKVRTTLNVPEGARFASVNLPGPKPTGSLPFQLRVSDLPEVLAEAPALGDGSVPDLADSTVVNGRIEKAGHADRYKLKVSPGQKWLISLEAASLGTSQLSGLLKVYDSQGKQLPAEDVGGGLDPILSFESPAKIDQVIIYVEDVRGFGGPNYAYRLQASIQPGDYALRLMTPYVDIPARGTQVIEVVADRHGYEGPIQLTIPDLPPDLAVQGGHLPAVGVNFRGVRRQTTRGHLTLTAKADAKPRVLNLSVWGQGGPPEHPIRRRAEGPGILLLPKEETMYDAQNSAVPARPVTAPWLGMELPGAIGKPLPAILEVATASIRLVPGMDQPVDWKLVTVGARVVPDIINGIVPSQDDIKGLMLGGITAAKGKNGGVVLLQSQPDTPMVKFDMVLRATVQANGKPEIIAAPAVTVELVGGYSLALAKDRVELQPGGKMDLVGTVRRESSFAAAVKISVFDPPEKVTCPAIEVPVGTSDFHLSCQAAPGAQAGDFQVHLVSSAVIPNRKDNREYNYPPLTAHFVVPGEKSSPAVASKH